MPGSRVMSPSTGDSATRVRPSVPGRLESGPAEPSLRDTRPARPKRAPAKAGNSGDAPIPCGGKREWVKVEVRDQIAKEENTANKMSPTLIEQAGELTDLTYAIRRALTTDDLKNADALLEELRSSALALRTTIGFGAMSSVDIYVQVTATAHDLSGRACDSPQMVIVEVPAARLPD